VLVGRAGSGRRGRGSRKEMVGSMRVSLALVAYAHSVWAQCDDATTTAETTCKSDNACTECSDFNFGDDCASNKREHCAEIECCPTCEGEIRSMFACEHGATCGEELSCDASAPPSDSASGSSPPPADDSSSAQRLSMPRLAATLVAVMTSYFSCAFLW
jgi:hypothetical protein